MGKRVIKMSLDPHSIASAIKELQSYKKDTLAKVDLLMSKLALGGADILRAKIIQMSAVMFADLLNSVDGVYANGTAIIRMGTDHAALVEFGTGATGAQNPHPDAKGWRYDVNSHGEAGWWYFGDWDGNWHWTKGMPSRPVVWETAKDIPPLVEKLAKEVFR